MKKTAVAPSNIAFIKYWGKKDEELRIPANASFSMNLSEAYTVTTVEFSPSYTKDSVQILNGEFSDKEVDRVIGLLDRIRKISAVGEFAKVVTKNSFPKGTGIASSASGFASLTVAGFASAGKNLSEKELTLFARMGSGSAARSIPDGFVVWEEGHASDESYAHSVYPSTYWDICDVLAIVDSSEKKISTSTGMKGASTSPLWKNRMNNVPKRLRTMLEAFRQKNFTAFGTLLEEDCLEMHAVMQSQNPPVMYWTDATRKLMECCRNWRKEGIAVYFTIDAGPNVHCMCEAATVPVVKEKLTELPFILDIRVNHPSPGARLVEEHLF